MNNELKPCPFCGKEPKQFRGEDHGVKEASLNIYCEDCGVVMHGIDAKEKWNTRVEDETVKKYYDILKQNNWFIR